MPAIENVRQLPQSHNSGAELIVPRHGIVTLFGYGIQVRVDRGHLLLEDGIGRVRRYARLPRVGHGLKRLVCISEDGFTTLSALKWLADVGVSFVVLNRTGKVLFVTGPTAPSDARLRRAQALAIGNGVGLEVSRALIDAKLNGQERLVRERLNDSATAQVIAALRQRLPMANTAEVIRNLEAQAAVAYFAAWRSVPVLWPKADLRRIPEHWRTVGNRQSPLSGGPRLAITPVHAILNYAFALLESETRLALTSLGLDAGLALGLHTDTPNRDSLALDVLEPVRPQVEEWLLRWIMQEPLRRADYFETASGNCRLMSHLCAKLSETAPVWGKLVASWAEYVARALWASSSRPRASRSLPTPLTQQHRREAKGYVELPIVLTPSPEKICRICGAVLSSAQGNHCALCGVSVSRANMIDLAQRGRVAAKSAESRARMSASQKQQYAARRGWLPSSLPAWLTQSSYREFILPRLAEITVPAISQTLSVSEQYAAKVRKGQHVPHPMHWQALAELAGVSPRV